MNVNSARENQPKVRFSEEVQVNEISCRSSTEISKDSIPSKS